MDYNIFFYCAYCNTLHSAHLLSFFIVIVIIFIGIVIRVIVHCSLFIVHCSLFIVQSSCIVRRRFAAALLPQLVSTTREPPVGFKLATNCFQCYAIANLDKTSMSKLIVGAIVYFYISYCYCCHNIVIVHSLHGALSM